VSHLLRSSRLTVVILLTSERSKPDPAVLTEVTTFFFSNTEIINF
jgi:hypothetical protein